jgi:hypothetical protein
MSAQIIGEPASAAFAAVEATKRPGAFLRRGKFGAVQRSADPDSSQVCVIWFNKSTTWYPNAGAAVVAYDLEEKTAKELGLP